MPNETPAVVPAENTEPITVAPVQEETNQVTPPVTTENQVVPPEPTEEQKMVPLAALHEERDKYKGLRGEFDLFKQNVAAMQITPQMQPQTQPYQQFQQPQQQQQQQQPDAQLAELYETDPRRAMQVEMQSMLGWYDSQNAALDVQMDEVQGKFSDFGNYRSDVRKYLRNVKPEQRGTPGIVETAYYLAKGLKADDLTKTAQEQTMAKVVAGQQVQGITTGSSSGYVDQSGPKLTEDEVRVAAAMNLTPEQYLAGKAVKK